MKARPILMHERSIQNLLAGRKTQTRRVLKPQPLDIIPMPKDPQRRWTVLLERDPPRGEVVRCRYGEPGDLLYVRETHFVDGPHQSVLYAADGVDGPNGGWTPSIHMPRWASRLTLELTDVRVERVQDCSVADIAAEGWETRNLGAEIDRDAARDWWQDVWNDTNGPGAWKRNDWCWCLTFKVHRLNVDNFVRAVTSHEVGCKPFRETA